MKRILILLIAMITLLASCTDKPEVVTSQRWLIYPNPVTVNVGVDAYVPANASYTLKLFDPEGKIIITKTLTPAQHAVTLDLQGKVAGKYQLILDMGYDVLTQELIKIDP